MIDYLELILDAQEQGEPGNELAKIEIARPLLVQYAAKQPSEADIREARVQEATVVAADATPLQGISPFEISAVPFTGKNSIQSQQADRNTLLDIDFLSGEGRSFSLYFPNGSFTRLAYRPWVNRAYRESVLTAQAATSLQGGGKAVTVSVPDTVTAIAPSAGKLDEIFARDARRYDSGFSMY